MITEQREFPGYEHTDEFRVPQIGERYQDECGQPRYCDWNFSKEEMAQHGGKRWILRKAEETTLLPGTETALIIKDIHHLIDRLEKFVRKP